MEEINLEGVSGWVIKVRPGYLYHKSTAGATLEVNDQHAFYESVAGSTWKTGPNHGIVIDENCNINIDNAKLPFELETKLQSTISKLRQKGYQRKGAGKVSKKARNIMSRIPKTEDLYKEILSRHTPNDRNIRHSVNQVQIGAKNSVQIQSGGNLNLNGSVFTDRHHSSGPHSYLRTFLFSMGALFALGMLSKYAHDIFPPAVADFVEKAFEVLAFIF